MQKSLYFKLKLIQYNWVSLMDWVSAQLINLGSLVGSNQLINWAQPNLMDWVFAEILGQLYCSLEDQKKRFFGLPQ